MNSPMSTADKKSSLAILALTKGALALGQQLAEKLPADLYPCKGRMQDVLAQVWQNYEGIICIMATGIVVRCLAPLLHDKFHDPAIVVLDEQGRFVISLLSGHIGGANALAREVAILTDGQAVLTTASDVLGHTALDLWCQKWQLQAADKASLTRAMGRLVNHGSLRIYTEIAMPPLPPDMVQTGHLENADLVISPYQIKTEKAALLHPPALVLGIGCNRHTQEETIARAVVATLTKYKLAPAAVTKIASIDLKADEQGLLAYAAKQNLPLVFFNKEELNKVDNVQYSAAVFQATGAKGVAEPAALLAAGASATLLVPKIKWPDVTTAVALNAWPYLHTSEEK